MKLNQTTQDILKNFSEINTNILIKPGSELNTISTMKNILAKATINESFDSEFGIYDLNEFLSVVSSLDKPELTLQEKHMTISAEGSRSKVKYFYSRMCDIAKFDKWSRIGHVSFKFQWNHTYIQLIIHIV